MVQISRRKIEESVLESVFSLLFKLLGKQNNRSEFEIVINGVFSKPERLMIGKRIALMYLILKRIDTNSVCKTLKITRSTYAKFSFLLERNEELQKLFKKLVQSEKVKDLFAELVSELYGPGSPGINWSEAWKRRRFIEQKKQRGI